MSRLKQMLFLGVLVAAAFAASPATQVQAAGCGPYDIMCIDAEGWVCGLGGGGYKLNKCNWVCDDPFDCHCELPE